MTNRFSTDKNTQRAFTYVVTVNSPDSSTDGVATFEHGLDRYPTYEAYFKVEGHDKLAPVRSYNASGGLDFTGEFGGFLVLVVANETEISVLASPLSSLPDASRNITFYVIIYKDRGTQ